MKKGQKNPIITKLRKGKHFEDFVSKEKAYKELNLYKTIIFHDFKGNKIRRRLQCLL